MSIPAPRRLKRCGTPTKAQRSSRRERGGMDYSTARLFFVTGTRRLLTYRRSDGTVAEFFVERG